MLVFRLWVSGSVGLCVVENLYIPKQRVNSVSIRVPESLHWYYYIHSLVLLPIMILSDTEVTLYLIKTANTPELHRGVHWHFSSY